VNTNRLYYTDCYLKTFRAHVLNTADDGTRVYLDNTAFYPASGGQPHDLGLLAGIPILDVVDEDRGIAHVLERPIEAADVECHVDWARRYDHMQQHTGQHLLSAVLVELFNFHTLSFHMGREVSTIELAAKDLTEPQIDEAEARVNEIVRESRPVRILFEHAEAAAGLRKPSDRSGTLRIIEIEGLDRSACGGTHVRSTGELGPIQIRKTEKIRGNVRIEFVCGIRALERAKKDYRVLQELARQAATTIDNLPEHSLAVRQRLTEIEKTNERLSTELARREGLALYQATVPDTHGIRRAFLRVPAIDAGVRAQAQAYAASEKAVLLAVGAEPAGVLIACSPDSQVNAGAVLKQLVAEAGGRGGGSATLAQGNLPNEEILRPLAQALGFEL